MNHLLKEWLNEDIERALKWNLVWLQRITAHKILFSLSNWQNNTGKYTIRRWTDRLYFHIQSFINYSHLHTFIYSDSDIRINVCPFSKYVITPSGLWVYSAMHILVLCHVGQWNQQCVKFSIKWPFNPQLNDTATSPFQ